MGRNSNVEGLGRGLESAYTGHALSSGNGFAEHAVWDIKGKTRCFKDRVGEVPGTSFAIKAVRKSRDGRTAWELRNGRSFKRKVCLPGEHRVHGFFVMCVGSDNIFVSSEKRQLARFDCSQSRFRHSWDRSTLAVVPQPTRPAARKCDLQEKVCVTSHRRPFLQRLPAAGESTSAGTRSFEATPLFVLGAMLLLEKLRPAQKVGPCQNGQADGHPGPRTCCAQRTQCLVWQRRRRPGFFDASRG